tara:strand:- start:18 stop:404 length:387 start_codon:yes stop_codon:yes gene_type:complete
LRSNNSFLTLIASFCLSAIAYNVAQPVEIPVQHLEFEPHVIQPRIATYEFEEDYLIQPRVATYVFDDYVIQSSTPVIEMDEVIIIAQEDEADDGDGANIDWMNDNWCLIHPDDEICQDQDDEDEVEGC